MVRPPLSLPLGKGESQLLKHSLMFGKISFRPFYE